jgi:hypothetical protein
VRTQVSLAATLLGTGEVPTLVRKCLKPLLKLL